MKIGMAVEILRMNFDEYSTYRKAEKIGIAPKILAVRENILGYIVRVPFYGMTLEEYLNENGDLTNEMLCDIEEIVRKMRSEEIRREIYSDDILLNIEGGKLDIKIRL